MAAITASLDGASQFSAPKKIQSSMAVDSHVSIFGTFTATVSVQVRRGGNSFRTIDTFTGTTEQIYSLSGPIDLRVGIESGNYTSGTAEVEIA